MGPSKTAVKAKVIGESIHADHGGADGSQPRVTRTCLLSQLHKTKLCAYHQKGTCQYGSECAFAHSQEELQNTPDLSKTRLCIAFQQTGRCDDPDCKFAHGEEQLRSTAMFYRKTLCIWNEKGRCRNGDQCRFAHGREQLKQMPKEQGQPGGAPHGKGKSKGAGGGAPLRRTKPTEVQHEGDDLPSGSSKYRHGQQEDEPMKIYPITGDDHPGSYLALQQRLRQLTGDEHPGSLAAIQQELRKQSANDSLHQHLETLCQQLSRLTVQCDRLTRGAVGPMMDPMHRVGGMSSSAFSMSHDGYTGMQGPGLVNMHPLTTFRSSEDASTLGSMMPEDRWMLGEDGRGRCSRQLLR